MKGFKRKSVLVFILVVAMLFSLAACGKQEPQQQAAPEVKFPEKPINVICAYAAGGSGDLVLRAIATPAQKILGQPVVVVNKTGGGGTPGHAEGANAAPDGYTLVECALGPTTIIPYTSDTGYTYEDFKPVYMIADLPMVLAVNKDSKYKTLDDFIAAAKANPGKLTVGNSGAGNVQHIAMEYFSKVAGIKITNVPFNGGAPGNAALLGGHIDAMCISMVDTYSQYQSGEFRLLGIMAEKRAEAMPDIPTFTELGHEVVFGTWFGVCAPKDTPDDVVKILADAFLEAGKDQSFLDACKKLNINAPQLGPEEFAARMAADAKANQEILKDIGMFKK